MNSFSIYDVFTPTTQARLNYVERTNVGRALTEALKTPGKQVVVYGESGSGKSTLLLKVLGQLYGDRYVTTRCSAASTFDNIILDAFDQLDHFFTSSRSIESVVSNKTGIGVQLSAVKASLERQESNSSSAESKRVITPQLTPQRLGGIMGAMGFCWVLEDFHKVPIEEKTPLAQMLKVFSDLAATYPNLRIVAVGATDTARDVVKFDKEMNNRVAEIYIPLMEVAELGKIIENGSVLLNLNMTKIATDIVSFSSGLASVTHHLALNSCRAADIDETAVLKKSLNQQDMEIAIKRYIEESSDTLKALFDAALTRQRERKYDNTRLLLEALASGPIEGMSHAALRAEVQKRHPDYPAGNVTTYLRKLTTPERGQVVRYTAEGIYRFSEPMLHSYAKAIFGIKGGSQPWSAYVEDVLARELKSTTYFLWNLSESGDGSTLEIGKIDHD